MGEKTNVELGKAYVPAPCTKGHRVRNSVLALILFCMTLLLAAGVLELGGRTITRQREQTLLRVSPHLNWTNGHQYDPDLMWALKPNLKDAYQGFPFGGHLTTWTVTTNATGLRQPPIDTKNRFRILALGDSRTYGMGVNDGDTWPAQLQTALDKIQPGHFEVINGGVTGYTAIQGLRYFEKRGILLQPDMIILAFGYNEGAPVPPPGISDWDWENPSTSSGFMTLLKRAIQGAGLDRRDPLDRKGMRLSPGRLLDTLLRFRQLCEQKNIKTIYLAWPSFPELMGQRFDRPFFHDLIIEAAQMADAPIIELSDTLENAERPIFLDDIHLNATGNHIVAEKIATTMIPLTQKDGRFDPSTPTFSKPFPADPETALTRAIKLTHLNPCFQPICAKLDQLLIAKNDPPLRENTWREIITRIPEAGLPYFYLGHALETKSDKTGAVTAWHTAGEKVPFDLELQFTLGDVLTKNGDTEGTGKAIAALINSNPGNPLWARLTTLTERYIKTGGTWGAIEHQLKTDVPLPQELIGQLRTRYGK